MTAYQQIIRSHLIEILQKRNAVTVDVVLQASEKNFVIGICLEFGYTPTFSIAKNGYVIMNAIKVFLC